MVTTTVHDIAPDLRVTPEGWWTEYCAVCGAGEAEIANGRTCGKPMPAPRATPLTAEERQELIHRPFFITYMGVSYPWSGTIVTNNFRRSVEDLLEEAEEQEMRRLTRLALLNTDESRFIELEKSAEELQQALYPTKNDGKQDRFVKLENGIRDCAARFLSNKEIAAELGVTIQRVYNIRCYLGV